MLWKLAQISDGQRGTDETVAEIKRLVLSSLRTPKIRLLTLSILNSRGVVPDNDLAATRAVFDWIRSHVRYVRDPLGVEVVQEPEVTLKIAAGDCDDQSALVASMLMSIGIPVRFRVIGTDVDNFSHILPEVRIGTAWLTADTTSSRPVGSPVPQIGVSKVYSLLEKGSMIGQETEFSNLSRADAARLTRQAVFAKTGESWQNGIINRDDLVESIRLIDEGSAPWGQNTFFSPVIREAFVDYLKMIDQNHVPSRKPAGSLSGIAGLGGFFGDVWNVVKSVVKPAAVVGATIVGGPAAGAAVAAAVYTPTGGGGSTTQPAVSVPAGSGTVTYQPGQPYVPPSIVTQPSIFSNPWVIGGIALVAVILLTRK